MGVPPNEADQTTRCKALGDGVRLNHFLDAFELDLPFWLDLRLGLGLRFGLELRLGLGVATFDVRAEMSASVSRSL